MEGKKGELAGEFVSSSLFSQDFSSALFSSLAYFVAKNITNITFRGNGSVKCLFYSQLPIRHQGDVWGDVFSQWVMFW
ncbi:MAG: hypothetical protein IKR98_06890 [Bacteroidaceae bacterium]|nr:hypothetical protein [Bacteroidaceae bacterium]